MQRKVAPKSLLMGISPASAEMPGTLPGIVCPLRIRQMGFLTFGLLQGRQVVL